MLVESPKVPLKRMYFRSPARTHADTTYIFPRGNYETGGHGSGGLILGGCRIDGAWSQEGKEGIYLNFAEDIKRRCCALTPELGKPEDLKVLRHGVGLRRKFDGLFHSLFVRKEKEWEK
jgi:D-amino-acid oxidase